MTADSVFLQRFCYGKLLVVFVFLACARYVSPTGIAVDNATPEYTLRGHDRIRILARQRLLSEERGFFDIPGVAKTIYKLTPNKQKAVERLFKHYKLDKKIPDIFTNTKFQEWEKTVTSTFKKNPEAANTAIFLTLKSQFGDKGLAKMLSTAREVSDQSSIAGRLQVAQFTSWLSSGKTVDDAFKILELNQAGNKLLANPAFRSWISYSEKVGRAGRFDIVSTLVARYGDEELAKILNAAKEVSTTQALATELQNIHLAQWLRADKTGVEAFKLLKLDKAGDKIFQSPAFSTWATYARALEQKNAYSTDTALRGTYSILLKRFDEVDLAKLLFAAKDDASSPTINKYVITQLQNMQFKAWKEGGEVPDTVAKRMMYYLSGVDKRNEGVVVDFYHFYHA